MLSAGCFLHNIAFCNSCIAPFFISSHIYAYTLDHDDLKLKEPPEQVQAKDTNNDPEQGKLRCI
jgi:hypothetical protein